MHATGWGFLQVETREGAPDELAAFAAGYIEAMTAMGLRGLGVDAREAADMARFALADVAARAPRFLPWWQPLG